MKMIMISYNVLQKRLILKNIKKFSRKIPHVAIRSCFYTLDFYKVWHRIKYHVFFILKTIIFHPDFSTNWLAWKQKRIIRTPLNLEKSFNLLIRFQVSRVPHFYICLKQKIFLNFFYPFFRHLFPPSSAPKLLKSNFFLWAGHEKLGYEHAFQPYTYSLRPFSWRGGRQTPSPPGYT